MKIITGWSILLLSLANPVDGAAQTVFPGLSDTTPAGHGTMHPCSPEGVDGDVFCGRFRVFEDRTAASGRMLDLGFIILKATDPDAKSGQVLIPLPGGPGQIFTNDPGYWNRAWAHLRGHNDILVVDVRGVGASEALGCPAFRIPLKDRFGAVFPPEHIEMCREVLADRANLELYVTDLAVDDLEELRRWLGYSEVNLTGGSYGTRVAQVYMRRHPQAVRAVILNSVVPVFKTAYVHMARSLQESLDLVIAGCREDQTCASQYPDLDMRLDTVLDHLSERPVEVQLQGETILFSLGDFSYAVRGLLYSRADDVPRMLMAAADGDWTGLAKYYLERTEWIAQPDGLAGHHFSALCAEDIAPLSDEEVRLYTEGTFMGDHLISGYRDVCAAWNVAKLAHSWWTPLQSDLPVLIISGERDPVTPPSWGDAVSKYLPNSLHIVVAGGGHVPRDACLRLVEHQFLARATVTDLDTACMAN